MIYFLFNAEDNAPYIKEIGSWGNLLVGAVDEGVIPYIKLSDLIIVSEEVALAWKFAGKYMGEISVRENTNSYNQLDSSLLQSHKDKFKYTLSEKDKENACLFHKAAMYFLLDKYYYNQFLISKSTPEELRGADWKSKEELASNKNKIIAEIKSCQDWQETGIMISNRFGIAHIPEAQAKIDL
jgi:hypothetical protein